MMIFKAKISVCLILFLLSSWTCFSATIDSFSETPLTKLRDAHPRIYFNKAKIENLREQIHSTHREIWLHVKEEIINRMEAPPDSLPGQNPMRTYAEAIPYFAVGYLMTGETVYLDQAKKWLLNVVRMKKWGNEQDLGGSHMVYGVAIVYDWLYHQLSKSERREIRNRLIVQVNVLRDPNLWWKTKALQNHLWINTTAIGIAGFALYGEVDAAGTWIRECQDKLEWVMNYLSPDGSSPEGIGYTQYGVAYLMKYFEAANELLGSRYADVFYQTPFFKNLATFFIYNFCPRSAWGNGWKDGFVQLNWGDVKRYPWYGPDYLLHKCASQNDDPVAQWFAREIRIANVDHAVSNWLSLIWYDPDLQPQSPGNLPTFHHFSDIDIAIMRSGWHGDESVFFFKCSPPMGHQFYTLPDSLIEMSNSGNGHAHYDANGFILFAHGEWLASDPGYTVKKLTRNHNTILVNDHGMINDGTTWGEFRTYGPNDKPHLKSYGKNHISELIHVESTPEYDYVIGDASKVYEADARLVKYLRHAIYFKPDTYLIIDELEAEFPSDFDWYLNTEAHHSIESAGENRFLLRGKNALLHIEFLRPDDIQSKIYDYQVPEPRDLELMKSLQVTPSSKVKEMTFITLLSVGKSGAENFAEMEMTGDDSYRLTSDDFDYQFDLKFEREENADPVFELNRIDHKSEQE